MRLDDGVNAFRRSVEQWSTRLLFYEARRRLRLRLFPKPPIRKRLTPGECGETQFDRTDVALIVDTYHHIDDRAAYFSRGRPNAVRNFFEGPVGRCSLATSDPAARRVRLRDSRMRSPRCCSCTDHFSILELDHPHIVVPYDVILRRRHGFLLKSRFSVSKRRFASTSA
jgi:hypothetical protein